MGVRRRHNFLGDGSFQAVCDAWRIFRLSPYTAPCRWRAYGEICVYSQYCTVDGRARGRQSERLKTSCLPAENPLFELNFIGASNSHSSLVVIFSKRWMNVASLFLGSYSCYYSSTFTHFATHRYGLFTSACGSVFPSSSLHVVFVVAFIIDEKWFRFAFGTRFVCVETEHYFFFSHKLKALASGCAETERGGNKENKFSGRDWKH